jgi:hypothetical protein
MGHIERIHLPGAQEQQTVMQFADDTSMTIASEERTVTNTISTLHSFSLASGLLLNWDKSIAYWWDPRGGPRPGWSLNLEVQWAELGDISKLLGTPFGLSLSADDVDQFLIEKIDKKLKYWITTRINNTGRAVVANGILISTALFFLAIWEGGGSDKGVAKVKNKVVNFIWVGADRPTRSRVAWDTCCLKKKERGLGMIDPGDAVNALMSKWIITACEPGQSNFKIMLRYRLTLLQPYSGGYWNPSMLWFTQKGHTASRGSNIWARTTKAWKLMVSELHTLSPRSYEEWLSASIWWTPGFGAIGPEFSKTRGAALARRGLRSVKDVWSQQHRRFWTNEEVNLNFGLRVIEYMSWEAICTRIATFGENFCVRRTNRHDPEEWLGIYPNPDDSLPVKVIQGRSLVSGYLNAGWQRLELERGAKSYSVLPSSRMLADNRCSLQPMDPVIHHGFMSPVRVEQVVRGPKLKKILLFYGRVKDLEWDPGRIVWSSMKPFMSYSTRMGREFLRKRKPVVPVAQKKWSNVLQPTFQFKWANTWDPERAGKEAGFIWQIWHRAVAVNEWRGRISIRINHSCPVCNSGVVESVLHRFWDCTHAKDAWTFTFKVLKILSNDQRLPGPFTPDMKQVLFTHRMPQRFRKVSRLWLLLRGVTLWSIWTTRNDLVFNQKQWNSDSVKAAI